MLHRTPNNINSVHVFLGLNLLLVSDVLDVTLGIDGTPFVDVVVAKVP